MTPTPLPRRTPTVVLARQEPSAPAASISAEVLTDLLVVLETHPV